MRTTTIVSDGPAFQVRYLHPEYRVWCDFGDPVPTWEEALAKESRARRGENP